MPAARTTIAQNTGRLNCAIDGARADHVAIRRGLMVFRARLDEVADIVARIEESAAAAARLLARAETEARDAARTFRAAVNAMG